jgi:AraC family ethanolamine operon transcriptional activator
MKPLVLNATDIDEMAAAFDGWQMEVVQQECGKFRGALNGLSMREGGINFYSARINRRVFANGHHLPGSVMFTFVDCPSACRWNGEDVHELKLFVSDAERGLDLDAGKGFISYSLSIDNDLLTTWFGEEGIEPPGNWNFYLDFKKSRQFVEAMNLKRIIKEAVYSGHCELSELRVCLLNILHPFREKAYGRIAVNLAPIHEAVELIHESVRLGREVNLEKVLEFHGGPMRTFYYNFKKYTGCTPHQYIKYLRLAGVLRTLKMADCKSQGVREIAYQFGFRHLGQFAGDYGRLFGEVPSESLKRRMSLSLPG